MADGFESAPASAAPNPPAQAAPAAPFEANTDPLFDLGAPGLEHSLEAAFRFDPMNPEGGVADLPLPTTAVPVTPTPAPAPAPANGGQEAPAPQPAAASPPVTPAEAAPAEAPQVSPEDMLALIGMSEAPAPAPSPAPAPAAAAPAAAPTAVDPDVDFAPFGQSLPITGKLAEMVGSEDPIQRVEAFGILFAQLGNMAARVAVQRTREAVAPQIQQTIVQDFEVRQQRAAVAQDLFGGPREYLKATPGIVDKAARIIFARPEYRDVPWSPKTRDAIVNLSNAALRQLGYGHLIPGAVPAAPATPTPAVPAPAPYEAGGARPGSFSPGAAPAATPESELADLLQGGF